VNVFKIYLIAQAIVLGLRDTALTTVNRLRLRAEAGGGSAEWVLILIGIIAIAAIVIGAVTAYVNTQVGKL
jgi:NADH:ubiquinone oxidoreductase subunit 2 (subunit N)